MSEPATFVELAAVMNAKTVMAQQAEIRRLKSLLAISREKLKKATKKRARR